MLVLDQKVGTLGGGGGAYEFHSKLSFTGQTWASVTVTGPAMLVFCNATETVGDWQLGGMTKSFSNVGTSGNVEAVFATGPSTVRFKTTRSTGFGTVDVHVFYFT